MGAFGGHFGAIQAITGPPEALDQNIEANLGWISPLSSAQNDLNTLNQCTVVLTITIQYWWGPFRAVLGSIWAYLGPSEAPEPDIEAYL